MSQPAPGPWTLPVEGWDILTVIFAFQIDIIAYGDGGPTCTIRLAGAFQLSELDGQVHNLDAEQQSWEDLTPVLSLRHDKIASATATEDAHLLVRFAGGRTLTAEADGRPYEHWQIDVPGIKLYCSPRRRKRRCGRVERSLKHSPSQGSFRHAGRAWSSLPAPRLMPMGSRRC